MIKTVKKDLTTVNTGIVIHGVNCQKIMNAGVAKAIKNKWPIVETQYKNTKPVLGSIDVVEISPTLLIVNCYTQTFFGKSGIFASTTAIEKCIKQTMELALARQLDIYSPLIGCGYGGLDSKRDFLPIVHNLHDTLLIDSDLTLHICIYN